jgi:hypothetical protein
MTRPALEARNEGLQTLSAKWRAKSARIAKPYGFVTEHALGQAQELDACADELDAAIRALSADRGEAVAADWTPTPANINALPAPVRAYIHQLVATCVDASVVMDNYRLGQENAALRVLVAEQDMAERVAQLTAHRACCGTEHDPENGKLHGYCVVCGVDWPCEYAGKPPSPAESAPGVDRVDHALALSTIDNLRTRLASCEAALEERDAKFYAPPAAPSGVSDADVRWLLKEARAGLRHVAATIGVKYAENDLARCAQIEAALEAAQPQLGRVEGWMESAVMLPPVDMPVLAQFPDNPHVWPMMRVDETDGWLWAAHQGLSLDDPTNYEPDDEYFVQRWMPLPVAGATP